MPNLNRPMRLRLTVLAASGLAALLVGLVPADALSAPLGADEIKLKVEQEYGVKVLKVESTTLDGQPAFRVTMMYPGGDYNTAFQVNTIYVDPESGRAIPQFRHKQSGYRRGGGSTYRPDRQPPDVLRQRPWH